MIWLRSPEDSLLLEGWSLEPAWSAARRLCCKSPFIVKLALINFLAKRGERKAHEFEMLFCKW